MRPALDFERKRLIGVVHLKPLPGAPRFAGKMEAVIEAAVADARAYESGGADAIFIENFGDIPFTKGAVGPETVAGMAAVGCVIRDAVKMPIGFNVLRNDPLAALALQQEQLHDRLLELTPTDSAELRAAWESAAAAALEAPAEGQGCGVGAGAVADSGASRSARMQRSSPMFWSSMPCLQGI